MAFTEHGAINIHSAYKIKLIKSPPSVSYLMKLDSSPQILNYNTKTSPRVPDGQKNRVHNRQYIRSRFATPFNSNHLIPHQRQNTSSPFIWNTPHLSLHNKQPKNQAYYTEFPQERSSIPLSHQEKTNWQQILSSDDFTLYSDITFLSRSRCIHWPELKLYFCIQKI